MIEVDHLSKSFGDTQAVRDLSFQAARGDVLGLLGPNGAGKTTTMRIVAGSFQPTAGTVRIDGADIREDDSRRQTPGLPAGVLAAVCGPAGIRPAALCRRRAPGAPPRAGGAVHTVERAVWSGNGDASAVRGAVAWLQAARRVGLRMACALVGDPQTLILDEPTSGLDTNQIVEIRSVIKEISRSRTVILSTHILSEAESTCDRIVLISAGRLVADGTADQVKRSVPAGVAIRLRMASTGETGFPPGGEVAVGAAAARSGTTGAARMGTVPTVSVGGQRGRGCGTGEK